MKGNFTLELSALIQSVPSHDELVPNVNNLINVQTMPVIKALSFVTLFAPMTFEVLLSPLAKCQNYLPSTPHI